MKNIFELFGFLSMACISAAIIFVVMGKKDALTKSLPEGMETEYSVVDEAPNAPKALTKGRRDSYASDSGSARRAKGGAETEPSGAANVAAEERLKALYNDNDFVMQAVKKWKSAVSDVADEYNAKPQVLLANAIVQAYLGAYSNSQLRQDAAQHAGDQVMSAANAAKRYKFSWSIQKVMEQHNLGRYFAAEIPTASASAARMATAKNSSAKSSSSVKASAPKTISNSHGDPVEEGFKNMVAKEYGFGSWTGLSRLADPDVKAEAQRRVRSLMLAARVK